MGVKITPKEEWLILHNFANKCDMGKIQLFSLERLEKHFKMKVAKEGPPL